MNDQVACRHSRLKCETCAINGKFVNAMSDRLQMLERTLRAVQFENRETDTLTTYVEEMVNKAVQSFGEKICSYHWDIFEVVPEPEKTEFLKYIDKESP